MRGIIGIPIPIRFYAPWEFVQSLISLEGEYPIITQKGALIEENRNGLFVLARNYDWLLMVDTDIVFTLKDVKEMEKHLEDADIVYGTYVKGSEPFCLVRRGAGFMMVSKKVLQLERPFDRIKEGRLLYGEDLSFFERAKDIFKIKMASEIRVGHLRTQIL